jgi:hypothetical protein
MAIGVENYVNVDTSNPSDYPNGNIKNKTGPGATDGTPVSVHTYTDVHQTFYRALAQAGITASGDPDNVSNGYQYAQAFGLEEWTDDGNPGLAPHVTDGAYSITVNDPADIIYNRYRFAGRTINWQIYLKDIVITGGVESMKIPLPAGLIAMDMQFRNQDFRHAQICDNDDVFFVATGTTGDEDHLILYPKNGASSFAGVTSLMINITAELIVVP